MRLVRFTKFFAIFASIGLSCPLRAAEVQDVVCSVDPSSAVAFVGTLTELNPNGAPAAWTMATFQISELLEGEINPAAVSILVGDNLCQESIRKENEKALTNKIGMIEYDFLISPSGFQLFIPH